MKILSFGSLNIDRVYAVEHFVRPGETLSAGQLREFCGGKGLNQSIALARAGAQVFHAGAVGAADGGMLLDALTAAGVDVSLTRRLDAPSGHAIIQVNGEGQNCILLFGGANRAITSEQIDETLAHFEAGDLLVLQNEINGLPELMRKAADKGLYIVLNPSPMNEAIRELPLETVGCFLLNEVEAADLCGQDLPAEQALTLLLARFPGSRIVLTLGGEGCLYADAERTLHRPAERVPVVDTTAAGDTFTGYFVAALAAGRPAAQALTEATHAAAIAVSRPGAAPSIPAREEVEERMKRNN